MTTKQLSVKSVKLSYLEKNPSCEETVFFLHGNSNSNSLWIHQTQDGRFDPYRLIFFDLPGHGLSSDIPSGDYSLPTMAGIMAEAIKSLANGNPYGIVGLSLGGNIITEMLPYGIHPHGIVFLSTGLVGEGITAADVVENDLVVEVLFSENPSPVSVQRYFDTLPYVANADFIALLLDNYYGTNKEFRKTFFETVKRGQYSDEISLIRKWNSSPLVIYGAQDKIVNPCLLDSVTLPYWKGEIVKIDNAAHLVNWDQPEKVNQLISDYFADSFDS